MLYHFAQGGLWYVYELETDEKKGVFSTEEEAKDFIKKA